jgi:hypothetical protein
VNLMAEGRGEERRGDERMFQWLIFFQKKTIGEREEVGLEPGLVRGLRGCEHCAWAR